MSAIQLLQALAMLGAAGLTSPLILSVAGDWLQVSSVGLSIDAGGNTVVVVTLSGYTPAAPPGPVAPAIHPAAKPK